VPVRGIPSDADLMAAGARRVERIGDATLILGDCRAIAAILPRPDAIVSDPPYGTADLWSAPNVPKRRKWHLFGEGEILAWDHADDFVTALPGMADKVILWGGQHYDLPLNRGWLVWNKIIRNFSTSVCELAWTNLAAPVDAFDYSHGQLANEGKEHPTQKPLPLMEWCIEKAGLPAGALCLDPYMGSGTTGVACLRRGVRFVGVEIEERYFDVACRRIAEAARQPSLFDAAPQPKPVQAALDYPTEQMA
jgi:site-specific DNA-methyltransferase (adenine-specific)/modification methylase